MRAWRMSARTDVAALADSEGDANPLERRVRLQHDVRARVVGRRVLNEKCRVEGAWPVSG